MKTIHIHVKDQFDFIEIYVERILPTIELLFQSEASHKIYKVIES